VNQARTVTSTGVFQHNLPLSDLSGLGLWDETVRIITLAAERWGEALSGDRPG